MPKNISQSLTSGNTSVTQRSWKLQIALWTLWTMAVLGAGMHYMWSHATQPHTLVGLIIRCLLVGLIGLSVVTKLEMHFEPQRFF